MSFIRAASEVLAKNQEIAILLETPEISRLKAEISLISAKNSQLFREVSDLLAVLSETKEINLNLKQKLAVFEAKTAILKKKLENSRENYKKKLCFLESQLQKARESRETSEKIEKLRDFNEIFAKNAELSRKNQELSDKNSELSRKIEELLQKNASFLEKPQKIQENFPENPVFTQRLKEMEAKLSEIQGKAQFSKEIPAKIEKISKSTQYYASKRGKSVQTEEKIVEKCAKSTQISTKVKEKREISSQTEREIAENREKSVQTADFREKNCGNREKAAQTLAKSVSFKENAEKSVQTAEKSANFKEISTQTSEKIEKVAIFHEQMSKSTQTTEKFKENFNKSVQTIEKPAISHEKVDKSLQTVEKFAIFVEKTDKFCQTLENRVVFSQNPSFIDELQAISHEFSRESSINDKKSLFLQFFENSGLSHVYSLIKSLFFEAIACKTLEISDFAVDFFENSRNFLENVRIFAISLENSRFSKDFLRKMPISHVFKGLRALEKQEIPENALKRQQNSLKLLGICANFQENAIFSLISVLKHYAVGETLAVFSKNGVKVKEIARILWTLWRISEENARNELFSLLENSRTLEFLSGNPHVSAEIEEILEYSLENPQFLGEFARFLAKTGLFDEKTCVFPAISRLKSRFLEKTHGFVLLDLLKLAISRLFRANPHESPVNLEFLLRNLLEIHEIHAKTPQFLDFSKSLCSLIREILDFRPDFSRNLLENADFLENFFEFSEETREKELKILEFLYFQPVFVKKLNQLLGKRLISLIFQPNFLGKSGQSLKILVQMTRDANFQENIEISQRTAIFEAFAREIRENREKTEEIHEFLCVFSNFSHNSQGDWLVTSEFLDVFVEEVLKSRETAPKAWTLRIILIFDELAAKAAKIPLFRYFFREEQRGLLIFLETVSDCREEAVIRAKDLQIWAFFNEIPEEEWKISEFSKQKLEKLVDLLVSLFYEIDLKATSANIKALLNKFMRISPEIREKVKQSRDLYKKNAKNTAIYE